MCSDELSLGSALDLRTTCKPISAASRAAKIWCILYTILEGVYLNAHDVHDRSSSQPAGQGHANTTAARATCPGSSCIQRMATFTIEMRMFQKGFSKPCAPLPALQYLGSHNYFCLFSHVYWTPQATAAFKATRTLPFQQMPSFEVRQVQRLQSSTSWSLTISVCCL